ncbi:Putative serine peptidase S28 family protein [Zea mays]|uniref:Putative serine peptidase S28 family protein n=1 Tax=Zea mays TaxID=4577 RepID=A0A1D6GAS4_MAIZE|nr:Putative serine peptidase S28 family protein [Zea mays]
MSLMSVNLLQEFWKQRRTLLYRQNWTVASTPGSSRGVVTLLDSFTEFTEEYELKMKEKGEQLIVRSFISATSPFLAFISATLPQSPHARRCLKI